MYVLERLIYDMTMNIISFPSAMIMRRMLLIFVCLASAFVSNGQHEGPAPIEGRWDITIEKDGKFLPSWLEVEHSGVNTPVYTCRGAPQPRFSRWYTRVRWSLTDTATTLIWSRLLSKRSDRNANR